MTFTQNAADNLNAIYEYSVDTWGKRVARKYIKDIDSAIQRIQDHPDLLFSAPDFHPHLRFYQVNKHLLVCDVEKNSIAVLGLVSTSMDIAKLLTKLQPRLAKEVEILHARAHQNRL